MKPIKTDRVSDDAKPGDDSDLDGDVVTEQEKAKDKKHNKDKKSNTAPEIKTPSVSSKSSDPARLCYVDDSRTSAYVVKRMLRPFGYNVDHYESAEPALIALVQGHYDLLLTDLKVSPKGMDGDDLVRALRNSGHSKISSLPVIVITGSTDSSILADVYEAGANQIMTKPVNGDELHDHIRKLVFSHYSDFESDFHLNSADSPSDSNNDNSNFDFSSTLLDSGSNRDSSADLSNAIESDITTEEVVLQSAENGFADFMGPSSFAGKSANVVFFDSEMKQNKAADKNSDNSSDEYTDKEEIEQILEDLDSIPVLNAADINNSFDQIKIDPERLPTEVKNDTSDGERRVLAQGVINDDPGHYIPKPMMRSAPAAKVKPTINVKPSLGDDEDYIVNSNADARREAAIRAKAAVAAAQNNRRIKAEKAKKKAQAATALKKLKQAAAAKAAAAKRVQLIKKQKAIAAAKAKAIATAAAAAANIAATKKKQEEEALRAENLQLTPKEGEPLVTSAPTPVAPVAPAPVAAAAPVKAASNSASAPQEMVSTKPIELIHPRDGGNIGSSNQPNSAFTQKPAAAPPPPPPPPPPAAASPPPTAIPMSPYGGNVGGNQPPPSAKNGYSDDILQGMDQFPLVEADMPDNYAPSRFMSSAGSLFELYGFKKVLMMALGILVVFFTYDSWSTWLNIDSGTPVDLSIVEQGEIFQAITVPGKVVSKLRVNITPSIAGRLTKVLADEGDSVNEGQLLARLDDREAKSYLKKATASYNSAKEDVVLAKRTLKRLEQAFKKGAVPRQLVEDAEVDLRSASARESISAEEVRSAKVSLENPRILAPFSGVITNRFVEVGQWVVPSESLFTLIDPKQREVEVKVDSADSNGIAVGQTVSLSSDAFPGLEWAESVSRLAAATTNVGNANTISVYISLGINSPSLRFGQQIDADIRTAWNPNAVKVPYGAIMNKKGQSWVAVLEGDKARLIEVSTGIEDFSHVEITSGVSIGETIILANGKRLRDGERVYLSTNN